MQVKKEFEFESAHRLSNYEGKCKRIHGHNYKVVVTVEGDEVDDRGILIDFGDIKSVVKEHIIQVYDHKLLLKVDDEQNKEIADVLVKYGEDQFIWFPTNPTAENMATHFLGVLKRYIPQVKSVEVFETPDSSAIASI